MGNIQVRPEHVYVVKQDRAIQPRRTSPTSTVAFRVHYIIQCGPEVMMKVTNPLWEHEAAEVVKTVKETPGMRLRITPDRPDGLELVQGWQDQREDRAFLHAKRYQAKKLQDLAQRVKVIADDYNAFVKEGSYQEQISCLVWIHEMVQDAKPDEQDVIRSTFKHHANVTIK